MTDEELTDGAVAEELYSHLSFRYIGSSSSDTGTVGSGICVLIDTEKQNVIMVVSIISWKKTNMNSTNMYVE